MKFSTREDVEAPIDTVFAAVTDFPSFERQAMRRGAEVRRQDPQGQAGVGTEWDMKFDFRGKPRRLTAQIVEFETPDGFAAETESGGLDGYFTVDLIALSPTRTRMKVALDMTPSTLTARLLIQSLKFAKGKLDKRFAKRIRQFAGEVEVRTRAAV